MAHSPQVCLGKHSKEDCKGSEANSKAITTPFKSDGTRSDIWSYVERSKKRARRGFEPRDTLSQAPAHDHYAMKAFDFRLCSCNSYCTHSPEVLRIYNCCSGKELGDGQISGGYLPHAPPISGAGYWPVDGHHTSSRSRCQILLSYLLCISRVSGGPPPDEIRPDVIPTSGSSGRVDSENKLLNKPLRTRS
ncbi:hypothetical protein BV20DRAFT_984091 [Pilatotrama ljubarskyi]|nr:hypothetical protein BV20DRAFT_984091 [Pilatotrama ljubarskyi]